MSQATLTIDDSKGGAEYTLMLNAALAALASSFSGTTAPADPVAGKWWADTSVAGTITLKMYDGAEWRAIFAINTATGVVTPAGLGTAAFKNTGTTAGNVVMLDEAGKLPAIDGSQLTGLPNLAADQTARDMAILNAFDISELMGRSVMSMGAAVVDAFEDTTGIDLGTSTGESHDAANDLFTNLVATPVPGATGTVIGNLTSLSGDPFDGVTSESSSITDYRTNTGADGALIGKDWGVGNTKTIIGFKLYGSNSGGLWSESVSNTVKLQGSTDSFSSSVVTLWSGTVTDANGLVADVASGIDMSTAYRSHRLAISGNGSDTVYVAEVEFIEGVLGDMTLVSEAMTAASAPSTVRVTLDHEDVTGTAVLNTDVTMEASRDGGTTWTAATLAALRDAGAGRKVLVADIDVSAQPSGTSVKLRGKQLNGKVGKWHRWAVQADVALAA